MDRETLELRLKNLETLKENHEQDIIEIDFCLAGLREMLSKMPKKKEKAPTGVN